MCLDYRYLKLTLKLQLTIFIFDRGVGQAARISKDGLVSSDVLDIEGKVKVVALVLVEVTARAAQLTLEHARRGDLYEKSKRCQLCM